MATASAPDNDKPDVDLTRETSLRYSAYLARARALFMREAAVVLPRSGRLLSKARWLSKLPRARWLTKARWWRVRVPRGRYLAMSRDVGESLRPVASEFAVGAAMALGTLYMLGDAVYHGYLEYQRGSPNWVVGRSVAHSLVFQSIASLAVPTVVIHTAMHQSQRVFHKVGRFTRWGPSVVGLATIPLLPLVDPPIERGVDAVFDKLAPLPMSNGGGDGDDDRLAKDE